jgi:hypothetical protein
LSPASVRNLLIIPYKTLFTSMIFGCYLAAIDRPAECRPGADDGRRQYLMKQGRSCESE